MCRQDMQFFSEQRKQIAKRNLDTEQRSFNDCRRKKKKRKEKKKITAVSPGSNHPNSFCLFLM